jgi:hypothetical protein
MPFRSICPDSRQTFLAWEPHFCPDCREAVTGIIRGPLAGTLGLKPSLSVFHFTWNIIWDLIYGLDEPDNLDWFWTIKLNHILFWICWQNHHHCVAKPNLILKNKLFYFGGGIITAIFNSTRKTVFFFLSAAPPESQIEWLREVRHHISRIRTGREFDSHWKHLLQFEFMGNILLSIIINVYITIFKILCKRMGIHECPQKNQLNVCFGWNWTCDHLALSLDFSDTPRHSRKKNPFSMLNWK